MSVKERKIIGMKYPNFIPEAYCCDNCHVHGVKLWCGDEAEGLDLSLTEFIPSSVRKLLCANCAETDQKVFMFNGWKSDYLLKIHGGREIGHLFPALPAEEKDNLFYGDYGMPSYAMLWWDILPASKPIEVMVCEKKLRLDLIMPEDKVKLFTDEFGKLFQAPESSIRHYTYKEGYRIQVIISVDEEKNFYNLLENFCENERIRLGRHN